MESISFINHPIQDTNVRQRESDGYINASHLCDLANKRWHNYFQNTGTKAFIDELSIETGIPASSMWGLVQIRKGGVKNEQGTWVHPQVAIHLAQWLSPAFAVKVSKWVFNWMSGKRLDDRQKNKELQLYNVDLTLDSLLDYENTWEKTIVEITHTRKGEVININKTTQQLEPVVKQQQVPTVSNKPSWLLIVEAFFNEIENSGIPEKMHQNMLLSKELVTSKEGQHEQHNCLFFRLSNLMAFLRKTPRFADLMNESTIQTASMLLKQLKGAGVLAFDGKEKEKGIPMNSSVPSDTKVKRVSHLVAIDLVVLERDYGVVMSSNGEIARAFH